MSSPQLLKITSALAFICVGLLSGCVTHRNPYQAYSGERLPNTSHSLVRGFQGNLSYNRPFNMSPYPIFITFQCVDGVQTKIPFGRYHGSGDFPAELLVKPGRHYINVHFRNGLSYGFTTLWLDTEPGINYVTKFEHTDYTIRTWFIEEHSGKVVGGIVGSEPEASIFAKKCL